MDNRITDDLNSITNKAFITLQYYSYEFEEEPNIKKEVLRDVSKIESLVTKLKEYLLEETAPCALTEK
tara:strand:- start:315 stop:518 length:204 start_codon:yes stop_codon:yes gene_type:complete